MALKENYKDDILDVSVNTKRKYRMTENADGTISLDDETVYTQEGDSFGASDMNAMAHAINNTSSDAEHTSYDNTTSGLVSDNVQGAIDEINDNLAQTPITVGGQTLSTIDEKLNLLCGEYDPSYFTSVSNWVTVGTSETEITPLVSLENARILVFKVILGSTTSEDGVKISTDSINGQQARLYLNDISYFSQYRGWTIYWSNSNNTISVKVENGKIYVKSSYGNISAFFSIM